MDSHTHLPSAPWAWPASKPQLGSIAVILLAAAAAATAHGSHGHSHTHTLPESLASLAALVGDDGSSLLIVCTVLLTTVPLVLMFAMPKNLPGPVERVLVSFALGTMLSDIFLHLLPETLAAGGHADVHAHDHDHHHHHDHDHHHHHGILATPAHKVLAGFLAFYAVERIMGLLVTLSSSTASHDHDHDHAHDAKKHDGECTHTHDHASTSAPNTQSGLRQRKSAATNDTTKTPAATMATKTPAGTKSALPPTNSMIHVFATSIHVASDGLLLSMAFSRGPSTGLSTFLGVFLHEIPHRLADWALIQGGLGMSRNQAIAAQLYLTCASLAGVFAGAALVPSSAIEQMMPIVAGGLLYTATVGVVPELTGGHSHGHEHGDDGHGHGHSHAHSHGHAHGHGETGRVAKLVQVVAEIGALVGGIAFMGNHSH